MHYGIDVASFQHPNDAQIQWPLAFSHLSSLGGGDKPFLLEKWTEGETYVNPYAKGDSEAAASAGFATACYHFVHAGISPAAQLAFIKANIPSYIGVFLDLEDLGLDGHTMAETFVVAEAMIADPQVIGIYVNDAWYGQMPESLKVKAIWLADPSGVAPTVARQITQQATVTVQGIAAPCDLNASPDLNWLLSAPAPVEAPAPTPAPQLSWIQEDITHMPNLTENSTDTPFVKRLQGLLNAAGSALAVDGAFGPATLREVLAFQHGNGLTADGVVGPLTWTKLLGV